MGWKCRRGEEKEGELGKDKREVEGEGEEMGEKNNEKGRGGLKSNGKGDLRG